MLTSQLIPFGPFLLCSQKFGEKEWDCTDQMNVSTMGDLCEQMSDELRGDHDVQYSSTENIQTMSEENVQTSLEENTDNSKPSAKLTESQLIESITAQIENIDEVAVSVVRVVTSSK